MAILDMWSPSVDGMIPVLASQLMPSTVDRAEPEVCKEAYSLLKLPLLAFVSHASWCVDIPIC